jgi:hypothetical protein
MAKSAARTADASGQRQECRNIDTGSADAPAENFSVAELNRVGDPNSKLFIGVAAFFPNFENCPILNSCRWHQQSYSL